MLISIPQVTSVIFGAVQAMGASRKICDNLVDLLSLMLSFMVKVYVLREL